MSTLPSQSSVLLTLQDVFRLKEERDSVAREHAALSARLESLDQKLAAISLFVPSHVKTILGSKPGEGGDNTSSGRASKWPAVLIKILSNSDYGLTTGDFKNRLVGTELENDVGAHGKSLHSALYKLVGKNKIQKHGIYYCLPGQPIPPNALPNKEVGFVETAVLNALRRNNGAMKAADIVQNIITNNDPAANGMMRSTGNFYKVLSFLMRNGSVVKDGRLYRLASKENEPHDAGASHGSDAELEDPEVRKMIYGS